MIGAMEIVGNPSSVHFEGRAAKALVERARAQVSAALGADGADVVFVSGATEGAALAMAGRGFHCSGIEHDAVRAGAIEDLACGSDGAVSVAEAGLAALQLANSETGIVQDLPDGLALCDATQGFGKIAWAFNWSGAQMALISAHKIGGPKGVGALVIKRGTDLAAMIKGGGQEMGRRAGTENVIGIAGFGAASEAAARDLEAGKWRDVADLRDWIEGELAKVAPEAIFIGKEAARLPNTACVITPGWKGETQVMQMDLAGCAISAGSACSSGKVKASHVLTSMGYSDADAACAIRVSIGPETTQQEAAHFVQAWSAAYARQMARAQAG